MRTLEQLRAMPALSLAALLVTGACVGAVLGAVAWNHLLERGTARVDRRVRSPIATATMMAFFVGLNLLISRGIGRVALPGTLRSAAIVTGLLLLVLGAVVNVVGRLQLGRNWADQVTIYRDQTLVQRGVFRLVRHPLYASLTWMAVGASLTFRNAAALAATFAVWVPGVVIRARQEERLLAERFPEYAEYRRTVGMLLPRLRAGRGR